MKNQWYAVIYTKKNGVRSVHYRFPIADLRAALQVRDLRRRARLGGYKSPYSLARCSEHF